MVRNAHERPQKLFNLLKLPQGLTIVSAQILYLRFTVPADLYKSGILVEVEGVRVRVNADLDHQRLQKKTQGSRLEKPSKAVKADKPRSSQSHVHDPGGPSFEIASDTGNKNDARSFEDLPTTVDLAQSFLQTEIKEEQADLKASIANSQHLDQSQISSEDGDTGVGNNLSLPAFLADFLQGVGDRMRLRIQDVELDLILTVDHFPDTPSGSGTSDRPEPVTLKVAIEDISVDGVSKNEQKVEQPDRTMAQLLNVQESRHVTLSNVNMIVISEASLFADLSRSTTSSSLGTQHATSTANVRNASRSASNSTSGTDHDEVGGRLDVESTTGDSQCLESTIRRHHSEGAASPGHENSQTSSQQHYLTGGDNGLEDSSEALDIELQEPLIDSETLPASLLYSDPTSYIVSSQSPSKSYHRHGEQSHVGARTTPDMRSRRKVKSFHPSLSQTRQSFSTSQSRESLPDGASELPPPTSDFSTSDYQSLAESKIFTHEEASMYMSAISHTPNSREERSISVPGHWELSGSDREGEYKTSDLPEEVLKSKLSKDEIPGQKSVSNNEFNYPMREKYSSNQDPMASQYDSVIGNPTIVQAEEESYTVPSEKTTSSQESELSSSASKGSLAVFKRVFNIDRIMGVLPITSSSRELNTTLQDERVVTTTQPIPGGFGQVSEAFEADSSGRAKKAANSQETDQMRPPYSIEIGEIQILGDMGLTRLMILVIQSMNALSRPNDIEVKNEKATKSFATSARGIRVTVQRASWKFFDTVKETPLLGPDGGLRTASPKSLSGNSEILLRSSIKNSSAVFDNSSVSNIIKISIGKFSFGYCLDEILSFDSGLKMRESTRDILAPVDNDIILTITRGRQLSTVDLTTLPVHMVLDLRRLDETFGWFGGFSSMLGLGSSMMSTMTVVDVHARTKSSGKTTRGVHFESPKPDKPFSNRSNHTQNKVTARIGGFVFDLRGTQSSLSLESTAMKVVSRAEGVGLQVDRLKFSGPYLEHGVSGPSISTQLQSLRVEYLSTPKEIDLARLLALLSPSKDKDTRDDDILLETLLRQRRQGAVVRATIESLDGHISKSDDLKFFPQLIEELKKLSTVAKYLPEDDRPGTLVIGLVKQLQFTINPNNGFGVASLAAKDVEGAHVTFPTLLALGIRALHLHRNDTEELIGPALPPEINAEYNLPAIMARFIGNEIEPTAKIKVCNLRLEYHVSTLMTIMGTDITSGTEAVIAEMISSVTTITSHRTPHLSPPKLSNQSSTSSESMGFPSKTLSLDISLRDSIIGLNPHNSSAKGLLVFTETRLFISKPRIEETHVTLEIKKASILLIDEVDHTISLSEKSSEGRPPGSQKSQIDFLMDMGFVSVGLVSAARATIQVTNASAENEEAMDVELRDDLFVLETCADSTQTLQSIMNGLKPPTPPSNKPKYMTEVVPIEDMLASFTGNAFESPKAQTEDDDLPLGLDEGDLVNDEVPQNLEFVSSFYNPEPDAAYDSIADSMLDDDLESIASPSLVREIGAKNLLESFQDRAQVAPGNVPLDFQEDHFGASSAVGGKAHKINTKRSNSRSNEKPVPLRIRVRDVHVIWNLFDGYDWENTRNAISQAVEEVQTKATERLATDKRDSLDFDEEEESVIGDFLFNSIYIGIPASRDPKELVRQVNRNLDDLASESESYATSTSSRSPNRQGHLPRHKTRKLRLNRSRYHKMTFELKGVSADIIAFPPGSGETQSSIDVRVQDLEIFDHVPTSTWKKFATYMHDAGERQSGTSMVHIEMLNVKPVPHLAASEIILKVSPTHNSEGMADHYIGHNSPPATSCRSRCSRLYDTLFRIQE